MLSFVLMKNISSRVVSFVDSLLIHLVVCFSYSLLITPP